MTQKYTGKEKLLKIRISVQEIDKYIRNELFNYYPVAIIRDVSVKISEPERRFIETFIERLRKEKFHKRYNAYSLVVKNKKVNRRIARYLILLHRQGIVHLKPLNAFFEAALGKSRKSNILRKLDGANVIIKDFNKLEEFLKDNTWKTSVTLLFKRVSPKSFEVILLGIGLVQGLPLIGLRSRIKRIVEKDIYPRIKDKLREYHGINSTLIIE